MASNSQSPRPASGYGHAHAFALNPATPVHSPQISQHSLHSSTSSRTPLHTLSLHEYRKLQNTPTSQSATPPGKTLRRKAAASALKEIERVPSVKSRPASNPRLLPRPLHLSQSSTQLNCHQPLPPSPPHLLEDARLLDATVRSKSAEPSAFASTPLGFSVEDSQKGTHKVRHWKSTKRLPKPRPAWPESHPLPAHLPPLPPVNTVSSFPAFQATPTSSTEKVPSSAEQTTPSTFSLSRFPYPPHLIDLSLSPPNDENGPPPLNTGFTTTGPATPPATPAVIHYRGTSFDLVNPHDSLLFHDIETPSRDLDSTDYLPLRSSEEPLLQSEMAPKRALFENLSSAHSTITRRDETPRAPNPYSIYPDSASSPGFVVPTPQPLSHSSPDVLHGSSLEMPAAAAKVDNGRSRFSLKSPIGKLTRTFTNKRAKGAEFEEQELKDIPSPVPGPSTTQFNGGYSRPLDESYSTALSPAEDYGDQRTSYLSDNDSPFSGPRVHSAPLSSMVPDDPSLQVGRVQGTRLSASASDVVTKPYYEEVASLYPSSSIYTEGGQPGLYSRRASQLNDGLEFEDDNDETPYNGEGLYSFSDSANRDSAYSYSNLPGDRNYPYPNANRTSSRYSRRLTQEYPRHSLALRNEKTDTISKFIDQYDNGESTNANQNIPNQSQQRLQAGKGTSGLSQFDFELQHGVPSEMSFVSAVQAGRARRPTITQAPGAPPQGFAPLAPAFEYDEIPHLLNQPNTSGFFSGGSSYGETRNLLQLGDAGVVGGSDRLGRAALEPSSSYSQNDNPAHSETPQEALDQAEQIFEHVETTQNIPAMWMRRGSGNLLRNRHSAAEEVDEGTEEADEGTEENKEDWETIGHNPRFSYGDSIANYSSTSEESQADLSIYPGDSLPVLPPIPQESSPGIYCHPSPLPVHEHPFSATHPVLGSGAAGGTPPPGLHNSGSSSPPYTSSAPLFQSTTRGYNNGQSPVGQGRAPWVTSPYTLSDKETQELLNSGPNDDILYEDLRGTAHSGHSPDRPAERSVEGEEPSSPSVHSREPTLSPFHDGYNSVVLERENSFAKFSTLGPKGNLTGTPEGTGMNDAGSSVADNSSPGVEWGSSLSKKQRRTGFAGFYTNPGQTSSRSVIRASRQVTPPRVAGVRDHSGFQEAQSPGNLGQKHIPEDLLPATERPQSLRSVKSSASGGRTHAHGRSAVPGQTKLRHMMLAPISHTMSSARSHSTHFSDFIREDSASQRASTANTDSPLKRPTTQEDLASKTHSILHELSPHLRSPERAANPELEAERRRLSWIIFGIFCIFPPLMILFRWFGDAVIYWVTNGRLGSASVASKRVALYAGAPLNILVVVAIVVPIMVIYV